ncbi:hypothetical protein [Streptomyces roseifaciens]|uniref:hypothetical protein n=1 Tax=Streptomyces roseifaciens TaxID=1488406 RepID=UPI000A715F3D|nr:hypothetical protein [Streptomyces roseifaciens]
MACSDDPQHADAHVTHLMAHSIDEYLTDPGHDPEFVAVLYSSLRAEHDAKWDGDYPPEGHSYPRTTH